MAIQKQIKQNRYMIYMQCGKLTFQIPSPRVFHSLYFEHVDTSMHTHKRGHMGLGPNVPCQDRMSPPTLSTCTFTAMGSENKVNHLAKASQALAHGMMALYCIRCMCAGEVRHIVSRSQTLSDESGYMRLQAFYMYSTN